jgi:hypothetical protein
MASLIKAFEQMRLRGLIAKLECLCECCGQEKIQGLARQWRDEDRGPRGFVHVGEWRPASVAEARVPLVFGTADGDTPSYRGRDCLAVGKIVAACLDEQNIPYAWDRKPGSPIFLPADGSVSGIPTGGQHVIEVSEDHRAFRAPAYPESAFDGIAGNPVRLLNVAKLRGLKVKAPHLNGPRRRPRVGDEVKLGFLVRDALAPEALKEMGEMAHSVQIEAMWVEVTSIRGHYPECVYRGELVNVPVLLDPAKVRVGSPVNFTDDQVYPAATTARSRPRR